MPNRTLRILRDTVKGTVNDFVQAPGRYVTASTNTIPGPVANPPGKEYAARIASEDLPTLQVLAGVKPKQKRSRFYGGQ